MYLIASFTTCNSTAIGCCIYIADYIHIVYTCARYHGLDEIKGCLSILGMGHPLCILVASSSFSLYLGGGWVEQPHQ